MRIEIEYAVAVEGDTLAVSSSIGFDGGRLPALALHPAAEAVDMPDRRGGIGYARDDGVLRAASDAETGICRLRYRLPVSGCRALLPDTPWLVRPIGTGYRVVRTEAAVSGPGGVVCGRDPFGGPPALAVWDPDARPKVLAQVGPGVSHLPDGPHGPCGIGQEADAALRALTEWLGPLGGATRIAAVKVPGAHAYSYPGIVFFDPGLLDYPAVLTTQYLPHELAHQWFGGRVRMSGAGFLWLQESLPEALQALYLRKRHGGAAYQAVRRRYAGGSAAGLGALLAAGPGEGPPVGGEEYHARLAAGTRLWLDAMEADESAVLDRLRAIAATPRTVGGEETAALAADMAVLAGLPEAWRAP